MANLLCEILIFYKETIIKTLWELRTEILAIDTKYYKKIVDKPGATQI